MSVKQLIIACSSVPINILCACIYECLYVFMNVYVRVYVRACAITRIQSHLLRCVGMCNVHMRRLCLLKYSIQHLHFRNYSEARHQTSCICLKHMTPRQPDEANDISGRLATITRLIDLDRTELWTWLGVHYHFQPAPRK